jgi:ADP-glucose pyrophosphorylase
MSSAELLEQPGIDFGKEIIPKALGNRRVNPYIFRGYWADVGTIDAFYHANIQLTHRGSPFNFFHPQRPIYTHPRFSRARAPMPAGSRAPSWRKGAISTSAKSAIR